jgi:protease I
MQESEMSQTKRAAILTAQMYEDIELWYPYYRLKEAGVEVTRVGSKAGQEYPSKHGYPAKADASPGDVSASDFDALVIPGGFGPDFMRRDPAMVDFVIECVEEGLTVAAICHGAWMLCSADALRGRKATSWSSIRDDVQNAGAQWVDEEVVQDGKIITSRCPDDLPAFCRTLLEAMGLAQAKREAA